MVVGLRKQVVVRRVSVPRLFCEEPTIDIGIGTLLNVLLSSFCIIRYFQLFRLMLKHPPQQSHPQFLFYTGLTHFLLKSP